MPVQRRRHSEYLVLSQRVQHGYPAVQHSYLVLTRVTARDAYAYKNKDDLGLMASVVVFAHEQMS